MYYTVHLEFEHSAIGGEINAVLHDRSHPNNFKVKCCWMAAPCQALRMSMEIYINRIRQRDPKILLESIGLIMKAINLIPLQGQIVGAIVWKTNPSRSVFFQSDPQSSDSSRM